MAENLNYEASGSKCYRNSTAYCDRYGKLYNWETAMKVCPIGWHLPSKDEWDILIAKVGGEKTAGKYLKAVSGWNCYDCYKRESGNTDTYGFSALPSGYGYSDGYFDNGGEFGYWWSTSEGSSNIAYYRGIYYGYEGIRWLSRGKGYLLSVRCLQDR